MDIIELENYTDAGLLTILKSKENELSMLKETYKEALQNTESSEGGLGFLKNQIQELEADAKQIGEYIKSKSETNSKKKPYVKPEIKYVSSNATMMDLINKINECAVDDSNDNTMVGLTKKFRQNRYKVATNNRFVASFSNLSSIHSGQIKSINFALAADKDILVTFYDYNYKTSQNEIICLEKVLLDTKRSGQATDIEVSSFDAQGNVLKKEIFSNCIVHDIYTKGMYDYSDDELRTITAVFTYEKFDVDVPQVGDEANSKEEDNN